MLASGSSDCRKEAPEPVSGLDSLSIYEFGAFRLDKLHRVLFKGDQRVLLTPKVFDTLLFLVENRGRAIPKEELMQAIWGDAVIEDRNLTQNVSVLRKALGESPKEHRYIVTLPNQGYLFAADVTGRATSPAKRDAGSLQLLSSGLRLKPILAAVFLAALAATALFWWRGFFSRGPAVPLSVTSFTSFPGREFLPAFSPDGSRIAFAWNGEDEKNFDIYVKPCSGDRLVRLTQHPAADLHPAWSPDGKTIAFVRTWSRVPGFRLLAFTQPPPPSGAVNQEGIYLTPADGHGTETRIGAIFGARKLYAGRMIDWLRDGSSIIVSDKSSPEAPFRLYAIDLKTGRRNAITNPLSSILGDDAPAVSPDGSRIAFLRCTAVSVMDIYVLDRSSGAIRRVTTDSKEVRGLTWTRGGDEIVFSSNRAGAQLLWRVSAVAANATAFPVNGAGADSFYPAASLGASRLAYARIFSNRNIWRTAADEGAAAQKFIYSTQFESHP